MDELLNKIVEVIALDITNIRLKVVSCTVSTEEQDALVKYYRLLRDAKFEAKERDLEEKLKRVEEVLNRTETKGS